MNRALRLLVVLVLLLLFGALPASAGRLSAPAATYLVTNTNNSGPNSLRQAIINANANPGEDAITFDLAGADQSIRTISINTVLPAITDPVVIDGSTQPDYFGDPLIQLRWTGGDNTGTIGLHITAGDSTVDSLTISGFEDGIRLEGGGDNVIVGNFIGTNGLGTAAEGNEYGVHILNSPRNFIGGTGIDARNLISGNDEDGILIEGAISLDNLIQGNYIGTDDDGTAAIPNDFSGIVIQDAAGTLIGGGADDAGNVISGNAFDGVLISFGSSGTLVRGNLIGTDRTGEADLGNGRYGVRMLASTGNSIGGNTVARRNVISGNGNTGVAIDGDENVVQGNFIGTDVDGTTALTNGGYGVEITGALSNTIGGLGAGEGNVISRNEDGGVRIFGGFTGDASNNRVQGNRIGTNAAGLAALGNTGPGVFIESASGNSVGGAEAGNVISSNMGGGVRIQGGSENWVLGNFIGTDSTGNGALPNVGAGVTVDSSSGNVIGGPDASILNVISANSGDGVLLTNIATQNLVRSNYIGVGVDGATDLGNGSFGLHIVDSSANIIGGTIAGAGNTISGNAREGILIEQAGATGNLVHGNRIGTNAAGTAAVPNLSAGVSIANSATDNTIGGDEDGAGNLISGNGSNGVHLFFGANDNRVQGNLIGTNFNGTAALENMGVGVLVDDVSGTRIGGPGAAAGNLISGNTNSGIRITDPGASETVVEGNTIGTNAATTSALPNGLYGIHVTDAPTNTIGGTADGAGNVISGNTQEGVLIELDGATGNVVQGNRIGTDGSGTAAVPNGAGGVTVANAATNTLIGGTEPGAGNLISGNEFNGILLFTTTGNTVQGNFIGTDAAGAADLGNNVGVHLDGASDNLIGGVEETARNLISGNNNYGVYISDASMNNNVMGNYIGTDATGLTVISNNWDGVNIAGLSAGNVIGGAEAGAGNLISGNGSAGIEILFGSDDNQVLGNRIGTNATGGTNALPNAAEGINVNSANNTIGGTTAGAGNLISGNGGPGIYFGGGAEDNTVQGNIIGTDRTGSLAMPNVTGIHIFDSPGNTIGGIQAGAGNLISGNDEFGLYITGENAAQNLVQGNRIGTDATGTEAVANNHTGVHVQSAGPNMIGGTDAGAGNLIAFNTGNGVSIVAEGQISSRKAILGNSIHSNVGLGIDLEWDGVTPNDEDDPDTGGNMLQNYPVLGPASRDGSNVTITGTLNSTASTTFHLEFFSNSTCDPTGYGEGQSFLGADSVTTDANGDATFEVTLPDVVPGGSDNVTATATDPENNTSEFSQCVDVEVVEPTAVQLSGLTSSPALPVLPVGAALGLLVTLGVGLVLRRRQRDS